MCGCCTVSCLETGTAASWQPGWHGRLGIGAKAHGLRAEEGSTRKSSLCFLPGLCPTRAPAQSVCEQIAPAPGVTRNHPPRP